MKTACIEAVRLAREQDGGDHDDLADRIHSRLQLPLLAPIPKVLIAAVCHGSVMSCHADLPYFVLPAPMLPSGDVITGCGGR